MTTSESKGRFFYKTNRIESIGIANWNALVSTIYVSFQRRYFRPNYASHITKMSQINSRYLW